LVIVFDERTLVVALAEAVVGAVVVAKIAKTPSNARKSAGFFMVKNLLEKFVFI
jgi:hypothetical protein